MRFKLIISLSCIAIIAATTFYAAAADQHSRPPRDLPGEEFFQSCGLGELSMEEQHRLLSLLTLGPMPSYTENAAVQYMVKQGWREVRVLGAVESGSLSDELWLVAWDDDKIYTLDPWSTDNLAAPGVY
jgi:hypothetical protein